MLPGPGLSVRLEHAHGILLTTRGGPVAWSAAAMREDPTPALTAQTPASGPGRASAWTSPPVRAEAAHGLQVGLDGAGRLVARPGYRSNDRARSSTLGAAIASPAAPTGRRGGRSRCAVSAVLADRRAGAEHLRRSDGVSTGRGAAWSAHLLWEQGVAGSNPAVPTQFPQLRGSGMDQAVRLRCRRAICVPLR